MSEEIEDRVQSWLFVFHDKLDRHEAAAIVSMMCPGGMGIPARGKPILGRNLAEDLGRGDLETWTDQADTLMDVFGRGMDALLQEVEMEHESRKPVRSERL